MTWKRCGHPRTPENTRGVSKSSPGGQCRTCYEAWNKSPEGRAYLARYVASGKGRARYARYHASDKGVAARRRHNAQEARNGKAAAYGELRVASGAAAAAARKCRAAKLAYNAELFAEAPEKRHPVEAKRVVVLSDLQIPFEDVKAVREAMKVIGLVDPDLIILNGDIVDCYAESTFLKDIPKAERSIPATHERVNRLLKSLSGYRVIWLGGNHEDRWRRLLWGNSQAALDWLKLHQAASGLPPDLLDPVRSFYKLFHMADFGIEYYPYPDRLYLAEGNLVVTHGKYVNRHSGQSAKRTWEWLGKSCIVGHTHRLGNYLITQDGHLAGAWENGCLCQLEPEFDDAPNWQQGFSVVQIDGPAFHVIQVPILRDRGAVFHGLAL